MIVCISLLIAYFTPDGDVTLMVLFNSIALFILAFLKYKLLDGDGSYLLMLAKILFVIFIVLLVLHGGGCDGVILLRPGDVRY